MSQYKIKRRSELARKYMDRIRRSVKKVLKDKPDTPFQDALCIELMTEVCMLRAELTILSGNVAAMSKPEEE